MIRSGYIQGFGTLGICSLLAALSAACGTSAAGTGTGGSTTQGTGGSSTSSSSTTTTSSSGTGGGTDGGSGTDFYAVLIRGTFKSADVATDQMQHDMLASMGEAPAKMLGDTGHHPFLGTTLLGTVQNQFMDIDTWSNTAGLDSFYQNPQFATAFGALFSAPPDVQQFDHQPGWHGWGDLTSGKAYNPYFFVIVRGTLQEADPVKAQAAHDAVATAAQAMTQAAGDVAHVVFTGRTDPTQFLSVDIWKASDNIAAVYTNPQLQTAFGTVFSGAPTLGVYQSTSWVQW